MFWEGSVRKRKVDVGRTEDLAGAGLRVGKRTGLALGGSASVREESVQGLGCGRTRGGTPSDRLASSGSQATRQEWAPGGRRAPRGFYSYESARPEKPVPRRA